MNVAASMISRRSRMFASRSVSQRGSWQHCQAANFAAAVLFLLPFCIAFVATTTGARAQDVDEYRSQFEDRLHRQGDSVSICVNTTSMTADFEKALAQQIGATLLMKANVVPIDPLAPNHPLDTIFPYTTDQLYVLMAQSCDAFMGFILTEGYPDWMSITRPYLVSRNVLAATSPAYKSLQDIGLGRPIGSRMASDGDASLLAYLMALPDAKRWQRYAYFDNQILFDRLRDGTIGAALIWEPALDFATGGNPASQGIHIISTPFDLQKTQIGMAVRSDDSFLRTSLSDAIDSLTKDGTIDKLLVQFHLAQSAPEAPGH